MRKGDGKRPREDEYEVLGPFLYYTPFTPYVPDPLVLSWMIHGDSFPEGVGVRVRRTQVILTPGSYRCRRVKSSLRSLFLKYTLEDRTVYNR